MSFGYMAVGANNRVVIDDTFVVASVLDAKDIPGEVGGGWGGSLNYSIGGLDADTVAAVKLDRGTRAAARSYGRWNEGARFSVISDRPVSFRRIKFGTPAPVAGQNNYGMEIYGPDGQTVYSSNWMTAQYLGYITNDGFPPAGTTHYIMTSLSSQVRMTNGEPNRNYAHGIRVHDDGWLSDVRIQTGQSSSNTLEEGGRVITHCLRIT